MREFFLHSEKKAERETSGIKKQPKCHYLQTSLNQVLSSTTKCAKFFFKEPAFKQTKQTTRMVSAAEKCIISFQSF